jgi:hypothetical protein
MILSTHAIVGGALGSLFASHPVVAVVIGFASHFLIDAIPHWDYPLRSISLGPAARNRLTLGRSRLRDLAVIACDGCAGLILAIVLFSAHATMPVIASAALAAMLPDALQFAHTLHPREPLTSFRRFHGWMHTKHQMGPSIGVSSQIAFVGAVVAIRAMIPI